MKKLCAILAVAALVLTFALPVMAEETALRKDDTWQITATSAYPTGDLSAAFDGSDATYWHSDYTVENGKITWHAECPHAVNVIFPGITKISGFSYLPRQDKDQTAGIVLAYKVFGSKDGVEYTQVYEGTFEYGADYSDRSRKFVRWGDVEMRAIQIEITESVSGYATAANITFLSGGSGSVINKGAKPEVEPPMIEVEEQNGTVIEYESGWEITASSNDPSNRVGKLFDNVPGTYWHTAYEVENGVITSHDENPHIITVKFPTKRNVSGFIYLPRQDADTGKFKSYNVYASDDGETFREIFSGSFTYAGGDFTERTASWGNVEMQAIRIEVTQSQGGYATGAEIKFLEDSHPLPRELDMSGWKISVDSVHMKDSSASWGNIGFILDGNPDSVWHSYYRAEGSNVVDRDTGPFYINIVLPEKDTIQGFRYTPRKGDWQGRLLEYNVKVSDSDDGEFTTIYTGHETRDSGATREVDFGIGVEVKRIQIETVETANDIGSISDFLFIAAQKDTPIVPASEFNEALYKTFYNEIDKSKFQISCALPYFQNYKLSNIFDGSTGSSWQSESATTPVSLSVDLGSTHVLGGFRVAPRQSSAFIGYWDSFDVMVSRDGKKYETVLSNYSFPERTLTEKTVLFDEPITARFVGIVVKKYTNNRVACGELSFIQTAEQRDMETGSDEIYVLKIGSNEIGVTKLGNEYSRTIDAVPYITSVGSTLIPLRGLLEEMGANIEWIDENQTIIITTAHAKITMQVGSKLVYIEDSRGNIRYTMTAPPKIKEGRTYIPVRFVSENLGYTVGWDGETQTITIQ